MERRYIQIVNHQVEDDVDVETSFREGAESVDLDEAWVCHQRPRGLDRGVEPLGMADRERDVRPGRGRNQRIGFFDAPRKRFFDERGNAGVQKRSANLRVQLGRDCDGDRVDLSDEISIVGECPRPARRRDLLGARAVLVHDRNELCAPKRSQDPSMVAPEVADADDAYAEGHALFATFIITKTRRTRRARNKVLYIEHSWAS